MFFKKVISSIGPISAEHRELSEVLGKQVPCGSLSPGRHELRDNTGDKADPNDPKNVHV